MELSERFIKTLEDEGYPHVYEWQDKPGTVYEPHSHKDKVALFVTDGSIEMRVAGKTFTLNPGDRYDVPPKTEHSATVGPDGVIFIVGEMIQDDS